MPIQMPNETLDQNASRMTYKSSKSMKDKYTSKRNPMHTIFIIEKKDIDLVQ